MTILPSSALSQGALELNLPPFPGNYALAHAVQIGLILGLVPTYQLWVVQAEQYRQGDQNLDQSQPTGFWGKLSIFVVSFALFNESAECVGPFPPKDAILVVGSIAKAAAGVKSPGHFGGYAVGCREIALGGKPCIKVCLRPNPKDPEPMCEAECIGHPTGETPKTQAIAAAQGDKLLQLPKPLNPNYHKPQALMMYNQPVPVQPNHALNDSTPWDSTNEGIVRRAYVREAQIRAAMTPKTAPAPKKTTTVDTPLDDGF